MYKLLMLLIVASLAGCSQSAIETQEKEQIPNEPLRAVLPTQKKESKPLAIDEVITLHEFSTMQAKSIVASSEIRRIVRGKPQNAHHQLLPSWLRVGENSLSAIMEQLQYMMPILYISENLQLDELEKNFISQINNPDLPMSANYQLPVHPSELLLYNYHFTEIERFQSLQPKPLDRRGYVVNHWQLAYEENRPVIYEYTATLGNVRGQLQLEFHGDFLQQLIFIPHQRTRIDVSQQALPTIDRLNLSDSTLGDVIAEHGFFGTLIITYRQQFNHTHQASINYLDVNYQQEVLWNDIALTINYHSQRPSRLNQDFTITSYTTLDQVPIKGITLFNLEDWQAEYVFLSQLASQHPVTDQHRDWVWEAFIKGTEKPEQRGYRRESMDQHFTIVNDAYIVYPSGCCAGVNHIAVEPLSDFNFPYFMFL